MQNSLSHVAIIMDGNGRWAQKRGLARIAGHEAGVKVFRKIVTAARDRQIPFITLYAFSSENWKRPAEEIEALFNIMERFIDNEIEDLISNRIRMNVIGDISRLSERLQNKLRQAIERTKDNAAITMTIALNYGGRDEIIRAVSKIQREGVQNLDEETFCRYLDSVGIPDPDLLIRTGDEHRISNFLLWQSAYAEIYFTNILWPDFTEHDLDEALSWFSTRERRYGMTREQVASKVK